MGITLQKIAGGVLFALTLIVGLNIGVDMLLDALAPKPPAAPAAAAKPTEESDKPLPQRLAAANPGNGKLIAAKCQTCHTFDQGAGTKVGPNLYGVVGRPKASIAGFTYSDGLKKLGGSWGYDDLDTFLTKPSAFAPGTKMTFPGLPSGTDRADVIAYLRSISPAAPALP
jgi:cytochrome c